MEAGGDFGGGRVGQEGDWGADVDGDFARVGEAAVLLLHAPETVDAHGDNRDVEILREQADAVLEGDHVRSVAHVDIALRKNQDAVAPVDGFTGKTKALAKAGKPRERENVEERDYREIFEPPQESFRERPFGRWVAERLEFLAAHGRSETMTKAWRKSDKDQTDIGATRNVIGDKDKRALEVGEVFAAYDARVRQKQRGGPSERVIDSDADQPDGKSLLPTGIDEVRAAGGRLPDEALEVGGGLRVGKLCFVEFDVVALLERGEQFDAVEGGHGGEVGRAG